MFGVDGADLVGTPKPILSRQYSFRVDLPVCDRPWQPQKLPGRTRLRRLTHLPKGEGFHPFGLVQ